jgi:hypothetical protein
MGVVANRPLDLGLGCVVGDVALFAQIAHKAHALFIQHAIQVFGFFVEMGAHRAEALGLFLAEWANVQCALAVGGGLFRCHIVHNAFGKEAKAFLLP